jgi:hypothetical protein
LVHRARRLAVVALVSSLSHATSAFAQSPSRIDALLAADSVSAAALAANAAMSDASMPAAQRSQVAALFGRFAAMNDADSRELGAGTSLAITRLAAGAVPDALESIEANLSRRTGRGSALRAITELGFAMRGTGAALRATTDDAGMMLLVCMAARDTAGVRDAIGQMDASRARLALRNLPPPLSLAEAELFLGDSAAALARLLAFDASWTRMERSVSWGAAQNGWLLGRTWLLLGDVAIAMGRRAEAARAYGRVVALWAEGDEDVQPAVAHARAGLAAAVGAPSASVERATTRVAPTVSVVVGDARVRYDAVLWMQPRVGAADAASRPLARLSFVATETGARTASGFSATQIYDSVSVDMPLLAALGDEGLALRRQIPSTAGSMTATTVSDSSGRVVRRSLHTDALLPEELRNLLERGVGFGPLSMALPLSGRAALVGDAWTDSISLSIPGTAASAGLPLRATYRLTRITNHGGRRLAFISIDAGTRGAVALAGGDSVQATLTGEAVRDLDANETIRVAASLRASVIPANGAPMPVRVLLTALREATAQPAILASR